VCGAFAILSTAACLLTQFAIVSDVNSKRGPQEQFPVLTRAYLALFREHRLHYPDSNLRAFFLLSLVILLGSGMTLSLSFILAPGVD
jgi:predicted DNA-binding helix-hairpin-helix protein